MLNSRLYELRYGFTPTLFRAIACLTRGGCRAAA